MTYHARRTFDHDAQVTVDDILRGADKLPPVSVLQHHDESSHHNDDHGNEHNVDCGHEEYYRLVSSILSHDELEDIYIIEFKWKGTIILA
mmetsp:Transcript_17160/g.41649  ORF Transcript_17160/g.41649 Transcript_17160/m.41649 type:complete len:90 (-) Transcript_17160:2484-2753(-)